MVLKTIAIVLNTSWNIFNFRIGLLKALQNEGYRIIAIAPRDEYSQKLEELGFEYHDIRMDNKGTNPIKELKLIINFVKLYNKIRPDVLLHYTIKPNIYGSIAAKIVGIPVISNISGLGTVFLSDSLSSKIARMLYKLALKVPYRVFYQNAEDRELFVTRKLVQASKTDLLAGSGIDTEKYTPIEVNAQGDTVRFLFVARLVKDKGIVEYVEAARKVIQNTKFKTEFAILGAFYPGNPTAITPKQMSIWESEGVVVYLGTSDEVPKLMAEYDCIVLPSYREGLSRVLLEAASMAKPIITTDTPGCRDVVEHGVNGYLCEVKDSMGLAEQMEKILMLSWAERKAMGCKGREKVIKEFDEKRVIDTYIATISSLLETH